MEEKIFVAPRWSELVIVMVPHQFKDKNGVGQKARSISFKRGHLNWGIFQTNKEDEIKHVRSNASFVANVEPAFNKKDPCIYEVDSGYMEELAKFAQMTESNQPITRGPMTSRVLAPEAPKDQAPLAPTVVKVPVRGRPKKQ